MIFSKPLYYVRDVKDYLVRKEDILLRASQNNFLLHHQDVKDHYSYISNTDYKLIRDSGNKWVKNDWFYFALSNKDIEDYNKFVYKKFKKNKLEIYGAWFNQYNPDTGSEHFWHFHEGKNLTNIYFIELKDKSLRTILKHPKTGKEIIPRVKEGQMLTFDGRIEHMSPPNHTLTRKTVVSFNINFIE